MRRRDFILTTSAALVTPLASHAYSPLTYAPADWRDVRDTQSPVVLNFRASWSLTCQIKAEILADLMSGNPDYQSITFVEVDWDTFGPSEWTKRLKVTRRSTLVAMRGKREVARLENQPYARNIQGFLDRVIVA